MEFEDSIDIIDVDDTPEVEAFDPKPELDKFIKKSGEIRLRNDAIGKWHMDLFLASEGRVELPYTPTDTYVHVNVGEYKFNEDTKEWGMVYDYEASMACISDVAKFAAKQENVTVKKEYEDKYFQLVLQLTDQYLKDPIKLTYIVNREVICERKVVGTKVVPATHTPERIEEVVEWDCKPVSLLGFDPNNTENDSE